MHTLHEPTVHNDGPSIVLHGDTLGAPPLAVDQRDLIGGMQRLGIGRDTASRTLIVVSPQPPPHEEQTNFYADASYQTATTAASKHVIQLSTRRRVTDEDGNYSWRPAHPQEINRSLWHEVAHLADQQAEISNGRWFVGAESRGRVMRRMGRAAMAIGCLAAAKLNIDVTSTLLDTAPENLGAVRTVAAGALLLGITAVEGVLAHSAVDSRWHSRLVSRLYNFLYSIDPAERFARRHEQLCASKFKAVRFARSYGQPS